MSFAVSKNLAGEDEWRQLCDGESVPPVLRTIPETVIGPGHNSIIRGPNNRELYCVYHRWTELGRSMAIDRMDFAGDRIFVTGATHTPQPLPFKPRIKEDFRRSTVTADLTTTGGWVFTGDGGFTDEHGSSELSLRYISSSFLAELCWSLVGSAVTDGEFGIIFETSDDPVVITFNPSTSTANLMPSRSHDQRQVFELPKGFDWTARHTLWIDADHRRVKIELEAGSFHLETFLERPFTGVTIYSDRLAMTLASFSLTEGFEELFTGTESLTDNGWRVDGDGTYRLEDGELLLDSTDDYLITKGNALEKVEFAVNLRLIDDRSTGEIALSLFEEDREVLRYAITGSGPHITITGAGSPLPLPANVSLAQYHQLRIVKSGGHALCYFDDVCLGEFPVAIEKTTAGIFCKGTRAAIEMVRLTSLSAGA